MNTAESVYTTVTALGADCTISGKAIILAGGQGTPPNPTMVIPYAGIKASSGVLAPVTEVDQITTGTITGANSTQYAIELQYVDTVQKKQVITQLVYTSGAVNSGNNLLDEIANSFIAQIQADPAIPITPTLVSHTLVLTAIGTITSGTNGSQQFTVTNTGAGIITFVTGTAAVAPVGLGFLYNQGATANANIVNTSYYYTIVLDFNDPAYGDVVMSNQTQVNKAVILVLSTATNVLTLVGTYGTLTQALAGKTATWTAAGTVPTMTNGVITLGGSDIFYGNSDTNIGLLALDVINVVRTTATAYNLNYRLASILSGTTAASPDIPNDFAAAAESAFYIHLTSIL